MTVPHQWPPDEPDIGVMAGWAPENSLEATKSAVAAQLAERLGELRDGDIEWRWFEPDMAGVVLDDLVEGEVDEAVFNYYRALRGSLREHGGFLVIAFAKTRVP